MTHRRSRAQMALLAVVLILMLALLAVMMYAIFLFCIFQNRDAENSASAAESYVVGAETTVFASGAVSGPVKAGPSVREEGTVTGENSLVIVLDPGHGLGDPGCESTYLEGTEAEAVLEITMLLKQKLESIGAAVFLTHDGEDYPSAWEIMKMADEYGVDYQADRLLEDDYYSPYERTVYASVLNAMEPLTLFLSLHINSLPEHPEISRSEIYYCAENPCRCQLDALAASLSAVLGEDTKTEASSYEEAFITTKYVTYPAVLIEMGYATNSRDAENLNSDTWRENFCETLAAEIISWAGDSSGKE